MALQGEQDRANAAAAADAARAFGLPIDVDPATALLDEVKRTAGAVAFLQARVAELDPDAIVRGVRGVKTTQELGASEDGDEDSPAVTTKTVSEEGPGVHIWVQLWQEERRHLVRACAAALNAGVEERRVRLAERTGEQLAAVIRAVLDDLDLTREQRALVATVVPRHLRAVSGL